jgi:(1->4)-alpha-D-glucan 1-alpha-D-glucosylmutase
VPDFYQGTEFWDCSLVDPDNRRPVDFAARTSALASMQNPDWQSLAEHWPDGHIKLAWTRHLLQLRNEMAEVFTDGDYQPLEVIGPQRDNIIAFARRRGSEAAIVAVGKSFAPLTQGGRNWPSADGFDAIIAAKGYSVEGFGGVVELPVAGVFKNLPVAVLKATFEGGTRSGAVRQARRKS